MAYVEKILLKNGVEIKRHFFNGEHYEIDEKNKVVKLMPDLYYSLSQNKLWGRFGFKKIGGSSLGNVLGSNPFGSKFSESIRIMWLGMPMFDTKYIDAGVAIEPKIVAAMSKVSGKSYETYDPIKVNYDYFNKHPFIGGIPDATLKEERMVYELKTTGKKNLDKWDQYGVPEYYKQQAALYDYLMFGSDNKVHRFNPKIVACFLEPEDYVDPKSVDVSKRVMKTYDASYNPDDVREWISKAKKFRDTIIQHNCSYPYDEVKDAELLSYLKCKNMDEYKEWLRKTGRL